MALPNSHLLYENFKYECGKVEEMQSHCSAFLVAGFVKRKQTTKRFAMAISRRISLAQITKFRISNSLRGNWPVIDSISQWGAMADSHVL